LNLQIYKKGESPQSASNSTRRSAKLKTAGVEGELPGEPDIAPDRPYHYLKLASSILCPLSSVLANNFEIFTNAALQYKEKSPRIL
jgi:hypothetical protein